MVAPFVRRSKEERKELRERACKMKLKGIGPLVIAEALGITVSHASFLTKGVQRPAPVVTTPKVDHSQHYWANAERRVSYRRVWARQRCGRLNSPKDGELEAAIKAFKGEVTVCKPGYAMGLTPQYIKPTSARGASLV